MDPVPRGLAEVKVSDNPYLRFCRQELGPDEIFVPANMQWSVAESWMRKFAEHHFREKCWWEGVKTYDITDRTPIHVNTSEMLAAWGRCRRSMDCIGVYFRIGDDLEIWADVY